MMVDLFTELFDLLFGLGFVHVGILDKFNDVGKRQAGFGRDTAYGFCG